MTGKKQGIGRMLVGIAVAAFAAICLLFSETVKAKADAGASGADSYEKC